MDSEVDDLRSLLDAIVARAAQFCDAQEATLRLVKDGALKLAADWGPTPAPAVRPLTRRTPPGRAVIDGQTIHVADLQSVADEFPEAGNLGRPIHTILAVPLKRDGEVIGVIVLRRAEVRPFAEQQIGLLETFADQAVLAIENARLNLEIEARNRELAEALGRETATSEVLRIISQSPTDLQSALNAIAEKAAQVCGTTEVGIRLLEGNMLTHVAHFGSMPVPLQEIPVAGSVGGRAIITQRPEYVRDVLASDALPLARVGATEAGFRSLLAVPLLREGRGIGVIIMRHPEPDPFSSKQIELLQTFADQAVIAIENVRLLKELHERNAELRAALERQTATGEILRIISSSPTEVTPVYEAIAQAAARVLDAPSATVRVRDRDELQIVAHVWPQEGRPRTGEREVGYRAPISSGVGLSLLALREGRTVHVPDVEEVDSEALGAAVASARSGGVRSILATPMWLEGEPVGVIAVTRSELRPFSVEEIALLETFAAQAVIATENIRLFHELEAKNAELEVASQHKSDFLSHMSHELRTPLNAILSFSEMLQEDATDNGHEGYLPDLQEINAAGTHLLELINDILDLAKIEAGRMDVISEAFEVADLVHEVQAMAQPLVEKNGNELVVECAEDVGHMTSDRTKVRQGLLNLLSNAAKFTEGGTVTLRVARSPRSRGAVGESEEMTFTVADTGIGMTEEQVGRLFEAFSQAEAGTSRKYGGTGLGLAITRRFCQLLGGDVAVRSEPGAGSTFTITLPVDARGVAPLTTGAESTHG